MTLTENVQRIAGAIEDIKNSIIAKGVTPTGNVNTFADAIRSIPQEGGGTDVSDTTATETDVLDGKVFHKSNGAKATGTIPSVNATMYIPGTEDYIIEAGQYLNGNQLIKGDPNLRPENIAKDVNIFGTTGTYSGGVPCTIDNLILSDYKKPTKNTSAVFTWSGKAKTIIVRYTLSNYSEAANSIYVVNVNDDASYEICTLGGSNTTPSSASSITNVNQGETGGSITLKNPSGAYTCYYSVMVFGVAN